MVRPPLPVPAASREPVDVEVEWLGHATVVIEKITGRQLGSVAREVVAVTVDEGIVSRS